MLFALSSNLFQVSCEINFAPLCVRGLAVYNPFTLVIFMNSDFRKWDSLAAVPSDVEAGSYLRAPQITTLFFSRLDFTSFIVVGRVSFASFLPKSFIKISAFNLVTLIPAVESSFSFGLLSRFRISIYFLAIEPPPQTMTNFHFL